MKHTVEPMNLTFIYRISHAAATENTVFSLAHGTKLRIDHIYGAKTSPKKFRKI